MSHRLLLAAVFVPALSTAAFAQGAPGDCADCYVAAAPVVVAAPPEVDLSRKLGVGLHVASLAIANHDDPNADPTQLGGSALREQGADGMPTGPEIHAAELGAMFHMRPGHRWDWYLLGAVGGLHEGSRKDASADHQGRAMAQLGVGVEHRWNRLGVGLELRAVGLAPADMTGNNAPVTTAGRTSSTQPPPPPATEPDKRGDHGAEVTFGATYYF